MSTNYNPNASGFYSNNSQYLDDNIYQLCSQLQEVRHCAFISRHFVSFIPKCFVS